MTRSGGDSTSRNSASSPRSTLSARIALGFEIVGQQQREVGLVLDDQNARRVASPRRGSARGVTSFTRSLPGVDVIVVTAFRPLRRQRLPGHEIEHGLGDVGGVVADALDVLRAEQQMRAIGDVARVFHHVGEQVAEHPILQRVEFGVALPDRAGALDVALRIGVEHVLQQFGRDFVHVLEADDRARQSRLDADPDRALGDVLGEIADALEIAGDADRADDLAQVHRHRLAARDGEDRRAPRFRAAESRAAGSVATTCARARVGVGQRVHRVDHHLLGDAAHLGDAALERLEFLVVGFDGVIDHVQCLRSAEAAGDVILRALVARRGEHLVGVVELDHFAEIHEGGEMRDARGLLHDWVTMAIV